MVQRISYEFLPQIAGPYVHAARHCETLYVSGLTAMGSPSQSENLIEQTKTILSYLSKILAEEQREKRDLIKLTIFITDINQLSEIRSVLFDFYEGYLPACSLVEVSRLIHPDLSIEIEAVISSEAL
ncbi:MULTISPECIES: RidA family protein [Vibrio]|jgi:2-iminobutanoate/2-iminopropanoate deaminase|uniref:RidA family protein n=1 Tax=Vibrio TaxID=662 RepID=UPI0003A24AB1|nr:MULTISPECIES: RidA family protein [Vibrio]NOJ18684.1 RidA family protein [Vibrio jasicida]PMO37978.1 enamine deaminase RidA [Vibrio sp. 10N.222.52.B12]PQJ65903.1 enamine deaminase RidA [Vibrio jasicida]UQA51489.1 RidA family protein [Vibrio sp. ED002]CAH1606647.1 Enamine deaminase RidA [Vibrio jasicida]